MPSLSEPAPTPGWAEAGPKPSRHHYAYRPHYIWRNGQEYVWNGRHYVNRYGNPVTTAAAGAVGGVADLGAIAAYPIYCFPYYGSCRVRYPYHGQY